MTSFVFPGQGSQFVGMAKDFYDNFKVARETFEEIQDYVKLNLKEIIFNNKNDELNITNYTQISIFTASYSIYKTLEKERNISTTNINSMLGHSLGEYTALACSNKLNLKDSSIILKKRGELMNSAITPNKTGMAALIGLNSDTIENIIKVENLQLEIANDNSSIQVVISGDNKIIDDSKNVFLENNVKKFVKLNVSAAFHSKFMIDAQNELNEHISNLDLVENSINIISNFTAEASNKGEVIKNALSNQMANRVRWKESIEYLSKIGENQIIEIGPGKVLSGLIRRISNSFDIKSVSSVEDLNNI